MKKRLITVQGPLQLLNILSTLFYELDAKKEVTHDTLCIYGLYSNKLGDIVEKMSVIWNWQHIVILPEESLYDVKKIKQVMRSDYFDEIYLCRNYMHHYDREIIRSYYKSKKITYGDGLGFIEDKEYSHIYPFDESKFIIGVEVTPNSIRKKPFQQTPLIYLKKVLSEISNLEYIQNIIRAFLQCLPTQDHNQLIVTLANLTESGYTKNVVDEVDFYFSSLNIADIKQTLNSDLLILLKPHPRENFSQALLLKEKILLSHSDVSVICLTDEICLLPVELFFFFFKDMKLCSLISSSCIGISALNYAEIILPRELDFSFIIPNKSMYIKLYLEKVKFITQNVKTEKFIYENNELPAKYESTLVENANAELMKKIDIVSIISKYKNDFDLDTTSLFLSNNVFQSHIGVYKCPLTNYQFYYPFHISGDSRFYAHLQEYEWYYIPWKWEHERAIKFIKPGMKVLEVGCGEGSFLNKLSELLPDTHFTGLELNQEAIRKAKSDGINVLNESIQTHTDSNPETYDVVCSFQVLEHISDVKSFLDAKIQCLKPKGKLIIGVPNNDSFLGLDDWNILNMPPHHMGLWNEKAFKSLEKYFPVKLIEVHYEPLQSYHEDYFKHVISTYIESRASKRVQKLGLLGRILNKFLRRYDRFILYKNKPTLENFTILVVFEKT